MAQEFKEVARFKTDLKKYEANHDHIFNKAKCPCEECKELREETCKEQENTEAR